MAKEKVETMADLTSVKAHWLREITETARSLYRALEEVRQSAVTAQDALVAGLRVRGSGYNGSPLGHQTPNEIQALTSRLDVVVDAAVYAGASLDEISQAYVAWRSM